MSGDTPLMRALAAIGVLVLVIGVVVGGLLMLQSEVETADLELDARQNELALLQRRPIPTAAKAEDVVRGDPYLEGATLSLAANALQQRLGSLVDGVSGKLLAVGIEPTVADEADPTSARRVVVQATLEMPVTALQTLLYKLETETPFAFVESLTVQRLDQRGAQADPYAEPPLHIDLKLSGYWRGGTS